MPIMKQIKHLEWRVVNVTREIERISNENSYSLITALLAESRESIEKSVESANAREIEIPGMPKPGRRPGRRICAEKKWKPLSSFVR